MIERLPFLLPVVLTLALLCFGLLWRRSNGQSPDRAFASKLAWTSIGLSAALVGVIFPAFWLFLSYTIYGGSIDSNVPPGYSSQFVLAGLLTGAVFTAISATYSFLEHLVS